MTYVYLLLHGNTIKAKCFPLILFVIHVSSPAIHSLHRHCWIGQLDKSPATTTAHIAFLCH